MGTYWGTILDYSGTRQLPLKDLSNIADKFGIVFETSKPKKIYPHWKLFTLNRLSHLSLISGKNNGFTANGTSFVDCPVWDKICKIVRNHPHLLSVGDDIKVT